MPIGNPTPLDITRADAENIMAFDAVERAIQCSYLTRQEAACFRDPGLAKFFSVTPELVINTDMNVDFELTLSIGYRGEVALEPDDQIGEGIRMVRRLVTVDLSPEESYEIALRLPPFLKSGLALSLRHDALKLIPALLADCDDQNQYGENFDIAHIRRQAHLSIQKFVAGLFEEGKKAQ